MSIYIGKRLCNRKIDEIIEPKNDFLQKKVLLIGEVQSGKTKRIEEILNKSVNIYNCSILLGGTNNLLNNQSKKRIEKNNRLEIFEIDDIYI